MSELIFSFLYVLKYDILRRILLRLLLLHEVVLHMSHHLHIDIRPLLAFLYSIHVFLQLDQTCIVKMAELCLFQGCQLTCILPNDPAQLKVLLPIVDQLNLTGDCPNSALGTWFLLLNSWTVFHYGLWLVVVSMCAAKVLPYSDQAVHALWHLGCSSLADWGAELQMGPRLLGNLAPRDLVVLGWLSTVFGHLSLVWGCDGREIELLVYLCILLSYAVPVGTDGALRDLPQITLVLLAQLSEVL